MTINSPGNIHLKGMFSITEVTTPNGIVQFREEQFTGSDAGSVLIDRNATKIIMTYFSPRSGRLPLLQGSYFYRHPAISRWHADHPG